MKKRADGRYCKQVLVGYDEDGKRKLVNIYGKTIREVEDREREIRNDIDNCMSLENPLLKNWMDEWFKAYKFDVGYKTKQMYSQSIKTHINPCIGNILIKNLKTIQIQSFLNSIVQQGKIRTAEICKGTLQQALKQARIDGIISRDIMEGIKISKAKPSEKRCLTNFEIEAIRKADLLPKERLFLDLLFYTGVRRGEALALTIKNIDFSEKVMRVNSSLLFKKNSTEIKSPKTKAGIRNIPIPNALLSELKSYCKNLNGFILFNMNNGNYMTRSSFRRFWEGIKKKVETAADELRSKSSILQLSDQVIGFTPHMFRHTYATNLFYAGVDIKTAQYYLGHSDINVTLNIYTHLKKENVEVSEAEKINNYLDRIMETQISQKSVKAI